jgi:hypothetical protein
VLLLLLLLLNPCRALPYDRVPTAVRTPFHSAAFLWRARGRRFFGRCAVDRFLSFFYFWCCVEWKGSGGCLID